MGLRHAIRPSDSWVFIQEKQKHSLTKTCMKAHGSFLGIAPSYYAWAAITKYRKLGVYRHLFLTLWRLEVCLRSRHWQIRCLVTKAPFLVHSQPHLAVSSRGRSGSFCKDTDPIHKASPLMTYSLPKAVLPIPSYWGADFNM